MRGRSARASKLKDGRLHEPVLRLFEQAMALRVPHNVFPAWMISPPTEPASYRPVSMLDRMKPLHDALAAFGNRYLPVEKCM